MSTFEQSGIGMQEFDIESLRMRLQKMTDRQLIEFGKAARFMCVPDFGRPPRQVFVIQLEEARNEWRKRHERASLHLRTRRTANSEWVFQFRNGTPLDPKNAGNRYLRPAVRKLGIALGGWHDFRHTLATQLLKHRHSTKMVSELLGHSDVKTTLEIYSHVEPEDFRAPLNERASELLSMLANALFCSSQRKANC